MNDDVDDHDGDDDDADHDAHDDCGDNKVAYHKDTMSVTR